MVHITNRCGVCSEWAYCKNSLVMHCDYLLCNIVVLVMSCCAEKKLQIFELLGPIVVLVTNYYDSVTHRHTICPHFWGAYCRIKG